MFIIRQTEVFASWLSGLRDPRAKQKIAVRLQRLKFGNFGDVKPVGGGMSELRIHEGKGYRVYLRQSGQEVILLLCGGNKKTQASDIENAKRILKELKDET